MPTSCCSQEGGAIAQLVGVLWQVGVQVGAEDKPQPPAHAMGCTVLRVHAMTVSLVIGRLDKDMLHDDA